MLDVPARVPGFVYIRKKRLSWWGHWFYKVANCDVWEFLALHSSTSRHTTSQPLYSVHTSCKLRHTIWTHYGVHRPHNRHHAIWTYCTLTPELKGSCTYREPYLQPHLHPTNTNYGASVRNSRMNEVNRRIKRRSGVAMWPLCTCLLWRGGCSVTGYTLVKVLMIITSLLLPVCILNTIQTQIHRHYFMSVEEHCLPLVKLC